MAEEIEHQRERKLVPGLVETQQRSSDWDWYLHHLRTDPEEVAFRRAKFGYDPWTEKRPEA